MTRKMIVMGVQQEIRQTRPFASRENEALVALLRTADVIRRRLSSVVERRGITVQQYNVLRILRGAEGKMPTFDIVERMIEQTPGITRLLDRLEQRGFVERERCHDDRRQVLCAITEAGRAVLAELDPEVNEGGAQLFVGFGGVEIAGLVDLLDRIRNASRERERAAAPERA